MKDDKNAKKSFHDEPDLQIGKNGITDTVINHVKELFKTRTVLKIKVLKNALNEVFNTAYYANELSRRVHCHLVGIRGHVFVIDRA